MTRVLLYTLDAIGEYTIAEDNGDSVTIIGQVEEESDARLFCAAPELLELVIYVRKCVENDGIYEPANLDYFNMIIAKALGETK